MSVQSIPPQTQLLYSKTGVCRGIPIFLIFGTKHRLWVLVRTASARRFFRVGYPQSFYIVKLGYAEVYLFFLFLPQNIDCASARRFFRVPTIYVLIKNKKNIKNFQLKIFNF